MGIENQKLSTPEEVRQAVKNDLRLRGITHKQAAVAVCADRSYLTTILNDPTTRFSKSMARRFALVFGYNVDYLMYGTGELVNPEPAVERLANTVDNAEHVNITIRVAQETVSICRRLTKRGIVIGRMLDDLLPILEKLITPSVDEPEVF